MNKKGFTLVELLAVIVILAIIAVIATPIILGVIEKAKIGAAEQSAYGYIDAVEKQIVYNQVKENQTPLTNGTYETDKLNNTYGVNVKGTKPETKSWVQIENKGVVDYSLKIGEYVVNYNKDNKNVEVTKNGTIKEKPDSSTTKSGPTMTEASKTDTHKGIVYLDPTDLSKTCDESNSVSTTSTKTGCMKWYIFDNSGDNYTMILDHNTTALIKWNDANVNVSYEESNLKTVVDDLVTTSGWKVTPRLITAEEVTKITGNTSFDSTTFSSWYYLNSNNQTKPDFTSSRSSYDWLYNNLNKCKTDSIDYGCTIEDNNTYTEYGTSVVGKVMGYWTANPVGSDIYVWNVDRRGSLYANSFDTIDRGLRPVITISKSIIS